MSAVSHTTLAEIVEDPCFAGYIDEAVRDTSQLIKSGIVQDNVLNKDVPEHARTVEVPFWPELDASDDTGADEVPSTAGEDLTTKKVEAKPDTGTTLLRSAKWGWSQFVSMYAAAVGGDPEAYMARQIGAYQAKREQRMLIALLNGVFARNAAKTSQVDVGVSGDLIYDITSQPGNACYLHRNTIDWAKQVLGDARGGLVGICCHSVFTTELKTLDPHNFQPAKVGDDGIVLEPAKYDGMSIIEDDSLPYTPGTGIGVAYLFGRGAVARQRLSVEHPTERYRDPSKSLEFFIRRWRQLLHPRGYAWIGTAAKETPSNTELATATNWKQVYQTKNIRIVKLACKLRGRAFEPTISVTVDGVVKTNEVGDASGSDESSSST